MNLFLNKYCRIHNTHTMTIKQMQNHYDTYMKLMEDREGVDPEFPNFKFKV